MNIVVLDKSQSYADWPDWANYQIIFKPIICERRQVNNKLYCWLSENIINKFEYTPESEVYFAAVYFIESSDVMLTKLRWA